MARFKAAATCNQTELHVIRVRVSRGGEKGVSKWTQLAVISDKQSPGETQLSALPVTQENPKAIAISLNESNPLPRHTE